MSAFCQIISSAGTSWTGMSKHRLVDGVPEPVVVDRRHAVAGPEDQVHEMVAAVRLGEPVRERHLAATAVRLQRGQRTRIVGLAQEDVQVLGVSGDPGVPLEGVRTAHQERHAGLLEAGQRPAVERPRLGIEMLLGARRWVGKHWCLHGRSGRRRCRHGHASPRRERGLEMDVWMERCAARTRGHGRPTDDQAIGAASRSRWFAPSGTSLAPFDAASRSSPPPSGISITRYGGRSGKCCRNSGAETL